MGIGPLCVLTIYGRTSFRERITDTPFAIDAIVLSLIVAFFLLDSLQNAMISPVYILCSGALLSHYRGLVAGDMSFKQVMANSSDAKQTANIS